MIYLFSHYCDSYYKQDKIIIQNTAYRYVFSCEDKYLYLYYESSVFQLNIFNVISPHKNFIICII